MKKLLFLFLIICNICKANHNFTLKDTISGSKWQIFDGGLISGSATQNLRLYNASFDGINTLNIRN
jgi:hypothetical protein